MKSYYYIYLFLLFLVSCNNEQQKQDTLNSSGNNDIDLQAQPAENILVPNIISDSLSFTQIPIYLDTINKIEVKPEKVAFKVAKTIPDKAARQSLEIVKSTKVDTTLYTKKKPGVANISKPITHIIPNAGYVLFGKDTIFAPKKTLLKHASAVSAFPMATKDDARFDLMYLDVEQGLKSSNITGIAIDSKGNIWMATIEGHLLKYDGVHILDYTEQLTDNSLLINKLLIDRDDTVWMALDTGIASFDGQTYTHYSSGVLNTARTYHIAMDQSQNIWASSLDGLIKFSKQDDALVATKYTVASGMEYGDITALYIDQDDTIYFGTDKGLSMFMDDTFYHLSPALGLGNEQRVNGITKDHKDQLWFVSNNVVYRLKTTSEGYHIDQFALEVPSIFDMKTDSENRIWLASLDIGVIVLDSMGYTSINTENGLSSNSGFNMAEDRQGHIWTSTLGGGVNKLNFESFKHEPYTTQTIIPAIGDIFLDSKEHLWITSSDGGLYLYDNTTYKQYPMSRDRFIEQVYEDHENCLWIGAQHGFYRYYNKELIYYDLGLNIVEFYETTDRTVWIAAMDRNNQQGKILQYKDGVLQMLNGDLGHKNGQISAMVEDGNGRLWIASNSGIYMYDIAYPNTMNRIDLLSGFQCTSLLVNNNELLVGSFYGLYKLVWDNTKEASSASILHYTPPNGDIGESAWYLSDAGNNNFWMGVQLGTIYLEPTVDGSYKGTLFNKDNGFFGNSSYGMQRISYENKDMMYWITPKGLTHLAMDDFALSTMAPNIQLNTIKINQQSIDYKQLQDSTYAVTLPKFEKYRARLSKVVPFYNYPKSLELPYSLNHLTFQFSAIDWDTPNALQYQYKVDGLDEQWSVLSKSNEADYRNIPYGSYTFKVKALANNGIYSDTFEYPFIINPPWWHTWWARTIFTLLFLLGIYGFVKWRIARIRKAIQKEQEIQENIKQLEDKALRAQMNPHFIFNTINGIQSVILLKGEQEGNKYISAFSKLLRFTLDMTNAEYILLKDEINYIESYLTLEKMRIDGDLNTEIYVDDAIDIEKVKMPCMLLQPIVENAILHGLKPKKEDRELVISFRETNKGYINAEIKDNGIGRKAAMENKAKEHRSWATHIMKERIETNNALGEKKMDMQIIDLFDGEHSSGTQVILIIPISY